MRYELRREMTTNASSITQECRKTRKMPDDATSEACIRLTKRRKEAIESVKTRECGNVKRLDGAGPPATKHVLLQHTSSQCYIAVQDNQVLCIPLQEYDSRFHMVLDIYKGEEMSLKSKHCGKKRNVLAIHFYQSDTTSSENLYLCPSDVVESHLALRPIRVQPMTQCRLAVLPTDTSPQFFFEIPSYDDESFCLESTSSNGNFVYVDGDKVFLKKVSRDDEKTRFFYHPRLPQNYKDIS